MMGGGMGKSALRDSTLKVIFAVEGEDERSRFSIAIKESSPDCKIFFPSNIAEVESLYSKDGADVIVTDFHFHGGALADWITFWPLPAVLLVDPGDDLSRVERTTSDEAALFAQRMPDMGHIRALPLLIKKALNVRESVTRQNAHLQMTEHQYMNLLQAIPDIVYILDGHGHFVYLNDAVRAIGYEPASLMGKHFSEIIHPDDFPKVCREEVLKPIFGMKTGDAAAPKLFDERRSGKRMTRNLEVRLKHGDLIDDYHVGSVTSYGEVSCSGYALPEFEGLDLGTVGIIRDVTIRKEHEQALESALASREVLLKEIHHRVKNNLQVVSSLLNIQETAIVDESDRKVFVDCQTQIQTMSMVHEVLYRSSSFEGVEMQSYFERLVDYLSSVYEALNRGIGWKVEAMGVSLNLDDAIPVALIVNELVSNCMKHAFPGGKQGRIIVSMREIPAPGEKSPSEPSWLLVVEDDGIGFDRSRAAELNKTAGIGTELVQALSGQLRGVLERGPGSGGSGAMVSVCFKKN
jgi:PAS domain S-box-containing protein